MLFIMLSWKRVAKIVARAMGLIRATNFGTVEGKSRAKIASYHKLYDILKQHQNEVNEIRAERLALLLMPLTVAQTTTSLNLSYKTYLLKNYSIFPTISQQSTRKQRKKPIVHVLLPYLVIQNLLRLLKMSICQRKRRFDKTHAINFSHRLRKSTNLSTTTSELHQTPVEQIKIILQETTKMELKWKANYMYNCTTKRGYSISKYNSGPIIDDEPMHKKPREKCDHLDKELSKVEQDKLLKHFKTHAFILEPSDLQQLKKKIKNVKSFKENPVKHSLAKKDFSKSKPVTTQNVSNDFSKTVTAQILPQNMLPIVKNTNVIAPGMTRQPMAVPISTRKPKQNVNQSVATSSKKTVATDSTVKKARNTTRKLYEQVSLSPGPQCQENVPQVDETVTTSNELELLYSPMFSELLNGTSHVVSKSSAVHAADNPDKRQQHNTTHTSTITDVADPPPLNIHSTHQTPTQVPTVTAPENIIQAETNTENAQFDEDEFINIFSTPVQEQGEMILVVFHTRLSNK
ncbi:hypothetical protein Tco_0246704 [Tanacetum coccineum]